MATAMAINRYRQEVPVTGSASSSDSDTPASSNNMRPTTFAPMHPPSAQPARAGQLSESVADIKRRWQCSARTWIGTVP
jgi:hypothetical protein